MERNKGSVWNRFISLGVRKKVQGRFQHFRNHAHTVYKTTGLDEVTMWGESR